MRNVSNAYLKTMEERRDFYAVAEITFQDGTVKTLEKKDFTLSGNAVVQSAGSSTFPLGMVIPRTATICLMNDDDRWSEYDFFGAKIFLKTKFDLNNGLTESINVGNFTVVTPESYGTTIEITATDDSYKLDKEYSTNITYPATIQTALLDSCRTCGVNLLSSTFKNSNFMIEKQPEDLSHRQFVGMCAMIAGGNAFFDEHNRLVIKTYDFSEFKASGLDGGYFDVGNPSRYTSGDSADGGSFNPWNTGDTFDGGTFNDIRNIHFLQTFKNGLKIGTDDVLITGVKLTGKEKESWVYGSEKYMLVMENQLAAGKEPEVIRLIGQSIVGLRFRPFTGDSVAYPLADVMDLALLIDRKGNVYKTVITDVDFQYYGFTTLKCSADSPIRNSGKYYGNEVKALIESRQLIEEERTEREKALELLQQELAQSSGLFMTKDIQEDGSTIYYMHDKQTLEESMIVWKLTAEAFGISTDGGKTYPYGLDVTGMAILNRIYAIGINCDYLTTGKFVIKKNNKIMVSMDKDTGEVILRPDVFELSSGDTINSIAATEANKKCKTFTNQPVPPYNVGDIWMQSDESDIMVCIHSRSAGSFFWVDWQKRNKYIDETDARAAAQDEIDKQTQEDIFNKLTDNGRIKGIYMENNQLYISFTYAKGGQLTLGGLNNGYGVLSIRNASNIEIGRWDYSGLKVNKGSIEGTNIIIGGKDNQYGSLKILDKEGLTAALFDNDSVNFYGKTSIGRRAIGKIKADNEYYEGTSGNAVASMGIFCFKNSYSTSGNLLVIEACHMVLSETGRITFEGKMIDFSSAGDQYFQGANGKFHVFGVATASSGYNAMLVNGGTGVGYQLYRSTSSSRRYKNIERNMETSDIENLYNIQPVMASYKDEYLIESDERYRVSHPMFIAENVEEYFPIAVDHDEDGLPENWNERVMIPAMFQMLKEQKKEIEELKKEIRILKGDV